jgi:hypothetical protein
MTIGTTILIITASFIIIGLLIWLLLLYFKTQDRITKGSLILNFMPNFANGHAIGQEVKTEKCQDGRLLIEYQPRDISDELLLGKTDIDNIKCVVDNDKIISLPLGTLSQYRDIKILLAPNPENYPIELKQTLFGKHLMQITEELNTKNLEVQMVREGSDRKTKMVKNMGDGEVSSQQIERFDELSKEMVKIASTENKNMPTRPTSGFHPPQGM